MELKLKYLSLGPEVGYKLRNSMMSVFLQIIPH